jgi:FkbM family methyltransferase
MKNATVIKDNKWVWPANDDSSWPGQNEHKDLYKILLPYVKNKGIMLQAGGNCGFILSTFIDHFDFVYTFEPDTINFYCLCQNITADNVFKMQACLGESNGTTRVQQLIRENFPHDIGGVHVAGEGYLPLIAIDSLNLPGCDLLQLDVEGFELKALKGAVNTIKKYKPVLCLEFCEKWLNRYEASSDKILGLLKELNYIQVDEYGVDKIFIYNEL